ncbi:MAG: hypothetical protein IPJ77_17260 [Planctomycetes bacterium]|nr:hypothetical protein [Planctomycetota bacterium]
MNRAIHRSLFLALLAAPAWSQTPTPVSAPERLAQGLAAWQSVHGSSWMVRTAPGSGDVELVYGGRASPTRGLAPRFDATDDEWIARAHAALLDAAPVLGIDVATLEPVRALHLPLGLIGSGDKWTVEFAQRLGGREVLGGRVNVLLDAQGRVLSIENHALAELGGLALEPLVGADAALVTAREAFAKHAGLAATLASEPVLVVRVLPPSDPSALCTGALAWQIDVRADVHGDVPHGITYWIDARNGYVLARESSVHTFDISGTVSTFATPGTRPDGASNAEVLQPAKYIRLQNGTFNVTADVNGNFTIPGVNTVQNATLTFDSSFTHVTDSNGATYSLAVTLNPGAGNVITLNPTSSDAVTAQANIFQHVATVRDYVRRINPSDATADPLYNGIANIAASCNAYYDGNINFYAQSATCANTAYSTVIAHEEGHGLNVRYGTGNGGDGMGEGNADVFALYVFDTAINGEDFYLNGNDIRNGNNTRQFCGDCSPACAGEVHADGEPWMAAAWKVRTALNTALGNTAGDLVADELFMGWMNAYNQTQIKSVIEIQWLLLDDDDANLANGTPHSVQIRSGFGAQGFPGYFVDVAGMTVLTDSACEQGSYPVSVVASAVQGTTLTSVVLQYSIGGGPTLSVPMTNTSGSNWTGSIPYVASPATVAYNVTATDSAGHVKSALCASRSFLIGAVSAFSTSNFEDANDAGWTHATVGDTSNGNDDWQRGTPAGKSGTSLGVFWQDPAGAVSGTRAWSNDLGIGTSNGAYQTNIHSFLQSPVFNCSGRTNVQLIFKRWLTVEESLFDTARILVNGIEVWRNPVNGNLLDTGWTTQVLDISAQADNNPSVTVRFELQSDGGLQLGGWQIDDLQLGQLVAAPACSALTSFCSGDGSLATPCPCSNRGSAGRGCANSVNPAGAQLAAAGAPNPDTLVLTSSGMPNVASNSAIFLQGDTFATAGIVFGDGLRCIDGTLVRLGTKAYPAGSASYPQAGDASLSVRGGVTPGSGVSRGYQVYYRNSASAFCPPATFNVTNAMRVIW